MKEAKELIDEIAESYKELKETIQERGIFPAAAMALCYTALLVIAIPVLLLWLPFGAINEWSKSWFDKK